MKNFTQHWRMILALALPSIVSFGIFTLSGTLNLIIIGQLGATAIAIVGVTNIVIYNIWALCSGIGHSVNYLVAQNYGAGTMRQGIERTYVALYVTLLMSLIIVLGGSFFADDILRLIGGEASGALVTGQKYLEIRFFAMACGIVTFLFHGFFRGIGDTKTPMIQSIITNVVMVILTYSWTYGHLGFKAYGLEGAAWSFFTAEVLGMLICMYVYFVRLHKTYGTRTLLPWNRQETLLILRESGKLGVQEFSLSIAMFIFTMFVAVLGERALAANEVSLSVMALGFMPAFAFGSTATILVGQSVGQNKPKEGRRLATDTAVLGTIFLLIIGTVEFFFSGPIARIYTGDPHVYELAAYLIMLSAFLQLFDGFYNFYAGSLRGIGDTKFLLLMSIALSIGLFIPLSYLAIFVLKWGSVGAWLSLYMYLIVMGSTVMVRFYRVDWSKVEVKQS